ncbi:MAG TPA: type II toxin-antitoxin system Phd/YefM family antitoxin [Campylobacterales bacterium]|nr:type II toxin-antitoxin system Phd/YefM family antitoxin [Campylobacterales bacterium]HHS91910.1 type II toxin-antitoxin system Phd/YefM family antitoxin [Campylobacterales bacterium]
MIAYSRNEIISATDMARSFSTALTSILNKTEEKLAISKNNKLQAVLIDIEEYERLKEAYDTLEHIEIAKKIEERKNSTTVTLEESMQRYGISEDDL